MGLLDNLRAFIGNIFGRRSKKQEPVSKSEDGDTYVQQPKKEKEPEPKKITIPEPPKTEHVKKVAKIKPVKFDMDKEIQRATERVDRLMSQTVPKIDTMIVKSAPLPVSTYANQFDYRPIYTNLLMGKAAEDIAKDVILNRKTREQVIAERLVIHVQVMNNRNEHIANMEIQGLLLENSHVISNIGIVGYTGYYIDFERTFEPVFTSNNYGCKITDTGWEGTQTVGTISMRASFA